MQVCKLHYQAIRRSSVLYCKVWQKQLYQPLSARTYACGAIFLFLISGLVLPGIPLGGWGGGVLMVG
jgi:hypothetical protein